MENYSSKKIILSETDLPGGSEEIFEKISNLRELLLTYNSAIREVTTKLEILNDELRDYRFYKEDMLHPSDQAVEYIWERFAETYFGNDTKEFLNEWKPIKEGLNHKPFNPESEDYKKFINDVTNKYNSFAKKWGITQ